MLTLMQLIKSLDANNRKNLKCLMDNVTDLPSAIDLADYIEDNIVEWNEMHREGFIKVLLNKKYVSAFKVVGYLES